MNLYFLFFCVRVLFFVLLLAILHTAFCYWICRVRKLGSFYITRGLGVVHALQQLLNGEFWPQSWRMFQQ